MARRCWYFFGIHVISMSMIELGFPNAVMDRMLSCWLAFATGGVSTEAIEMVARPNRSSFLQVSASRPKPSSAIWYIWCILIKISWLISRASNLNIHTPNHLYCCEGSLKPLHLLVEQTHTQYILQDLWNFSSKFLCSEYPSSHNPGPSAPCPASTGS